MLIFREVESKYKRERKHKLSLIKSNMLIFTEVESKYERKLRSLREELELRRKTEMHELEEVSSVLHHILA